MSKSEVERFAKDLKTKPALLADVAAVAERHGYRFSADDAKALSDAQLDAVSGGGRKPVMVVAEKELDKLSGGTRSVLASGGPPILPFEKD